MYVDQETDIAAMAVQTPTAPDRKTGRPDVAVVAQKVSDQALRKIKNQSQKQNDNLSCYFGVDARSPTKADKIIGQRVRLARKLAKFSQTTLGDAIGVTYQQVQKYENCTDRIGAGRLYHVARATDQPITFFSDDNVAHSNAIGVSGALLADPRIEKLLVAVAKVENSKLIANLVSIADTFAAAHANE